MEDARLRDLRHDFRAYYHVAYEDVPVAEAVDLIATLPDGSRVASALSPSRAWSPERHGPPTSSTRCGPSPRGRRGA